MASSKLIRLPQVMDKTSLKRSQIYFYMQKGVFPKSVRIGPATVAWLESEVDDWIRERSAQR